MQRVAFLVACNLTLFFLSPGLYFLEDPAESFHYLSQSGCLKDKSLNDKELYNSVMVGVTSLTLYFTQCFNN